MKNIFFILSLAVFACVIGCNKQQIETQAKPPVTISGLEGDGENEPCSTNPANIYEFMGQQHNLALDAMAASPNFPILTEEEAHNLAYQAITIVPLPPLPYQECVPAYTFIENSPNPMVEAADFALSRGDISLNARNRIAELHDIVQSCDSIEQFDSLILDFENDVISEGGYSDLEQEMILGAAAVARYSKCYWVNAYLDENNPWHIYVSDDGDGYTPGSTDAGDRGKGKLKAWFKKNKNKIAGDIAGASVGAWVGFKAGLLVGTIFWGPGPGTVLGGVISGAVGGIVLGAVVSWKAK